MELTEHEARSSNEILSEHDPLYEGQVTRVNFYKHQKPNCHAYQQGDKPALDNYADIYSIDFIAKKTREGVLVWCHLPQINEDR